VSLYVNHLYAGLGKVGICVNCKHFDKERYLEDIKQGKLISNACKKGMPLSTISYRIGCTEFEPNELEEVEADLERFRRGCFG